MCNLNGSLHKTNRKVTHQFKYHLKYFVSGGICAGFQSGDGDDVTVVARLVWELYLDVKLLSDLRDRSPTATDDLRMVLWIDSDVQFEVPQHLEIQSNSLNDISKGQETKVPTVDRDDIHELNKMIMNGLEILLHQWFCKYK